MSIASMLAFARKIENAYAAQCQPFLTRFGIAKTSFDILMFLANNPQHYTAREISEIRNIKPNVVSLHVDRLVNDGYLGRQSIAQDRRKIRLVCTQKAAPIITEGRKLQKAFYLDLIQGLSDHDLTQFRNCFRVIEENADKIQKQKITLK